MQDYDIIVVGLGIYGSAVAAEAATKGLRVLGVDQFTPPHNHGSSHGGSRVFRLTTVEAEEYIPRAKRALELWKSYDKDNLIHETGFAIITQPSAIEQAHHGVNHLVDRAATMAERYDIPYELLRGEQLMERFSGLRIGSGDRVFYESTACIIKPETAVETFLEKAHTSGATIVTGVQATGLEANARGAKINIDGQIFTAKHIAVCTGPWQHASLLGRRENPIRATIQPQIVLRTPYQPTLIEKQFPGFVYMSKGQPLVYAVPPSAYLPEIKMGIEQSDIAIAQPSPDLLPTTFTEDVARIIRQRAAKLLPEIDLTNAEIDLCYYTVTSGSKHIIRKLDANAAITLVSACSGHGFKYAPAIAEEIINDFIR